MTDLVARSARIALELCGEALEEIERLRLENWQLKGALGYSVPSDIPSGNFRCGFCDARTATEVTIFQPENEIEIYK